MDNNRRKRLPRNNLPKNPLELLPGNTNQPDQQVATLTQSHRLVCQLIKCLEEKVRSFLEEVSNGEYTELLESEDLSELLEDLILYARYQRFNAECCEREIGELKQFSQYSPKNIAKAREGLDKIRHERDIVLADLKRIKKRRRNKRRRR